MNEPLPKFILLVPLYFNDGTQIPNDILLDFQEELFLLGGGYTEAGTVRGVYRMVDGTKQTDVCAQLWIGVPRTSIEELKKAVGKLGKTLGQESMYFEETGSMIHFIPPHNGEDQQ